MLQDHQWLLGGAFISVVVAPLLAPFILRLDGRTRGLLVLAGAIFLQAKGVVINVLIGENQTARVGDPYPASGTASSL
jgi:hypothetical protein